MQLQEIIEYIDTLLVEAVTRPDENGVSEVDEIDAELRALGLIAKARIALDIIEAQTVHGLRTRIPQISYGEIGDAQGISKQASRIRHTKLEQVLKVHQLDGRRHSMSKVVVPPRHRRSAKPNRQARRISDQAN